MHFGESKVYFDGSHYIAIPHIEQPTKKYTKSFEEPITIMQDEDGKGSLAKLSNEPFISSENNIKNNTNKKDKNENSNKSIIVTTKKKLFNELYTKYIDLPKSKRIEKIVECMSFLFSNLELCKFFVIQNFERKLRNLICRRVRMCRKANLANFNYFCTFTYDNAKHNEISFKKGIQTCLRNFCYRKDWAYMGVWERAKETNRLHFHGLFRIPNGTIPGDLITVKDYDLNAHKIQTNIQSSYFNERFGRSDFKEIDENEKRLGNALAYLMKYIEKTGERIVYSKGLPQYFISDILEEDIVCTIGQEDRKLLLFDDFTCMDDGEIIGKVSADVIRKLRKCN